MNDFKMKIQEVKLRCCNSFRNLKRSCRRLIIKLERKMGLATRCAFCEDNIFCEVYAGYPKRGFFHVRRCSDKTSTR